MRTRLGEVRGLGNVHSRQVVLVFFGLLVLFLFFLAFMFPARRIFVVVVLS